MLENGGNQFSSHATWKQIITKTWFRSVIMNLVAVFRIEIKFNEMGSRFFRSGEGLFKKEGASFVKWHESTVYPSFPCLTSSCFSTSSLSFSALN